MSSTTLAPPVPRSEAALERRWRPTRAGLVNVWRYLEESFEFHGGRLLLRGPNGSGKSMALELLFPFLLDASALPTRLSSSARSRGGLYDRIMGGSDKDVRIGFLWAEFTRGEDAFTIGARVRASKSTARATTDWFTTSQRVGHELFLLDEARMPLSKKTPSVRAARSIPVPRTTAPRSPPGCSPATATSSTTRSSPRSSRCARRSCRRTC